jgi:hypothetical protein
MIIDVRFLTDCRTLVVRQASQPRVTGQDGAPVNTKRLPVTFPVA